MKLRHVQDRGLYSDVIATGCQKSVKIKDLDFRVPCGKCMHCQKKRRSDWSLRLEDEYYSSDSAYFVTLTYNDYSIPYTPDMQQTLYKKHVQDYIKRLRNVQVKLVKGMYKCTAKEVLKYIKPIRYYAVGEYGSKTQRPHYHILLFNLETSLEHEITNQWINKATKFPLGHVDVGTVSGASINYVTKYMFKPFDADDQRTRPFSLMSKGRRLSDEKKREGYKEFGILGFSYLKNYGDWHYQNKQLTRADYNGKLRRLPRAYLRRIFSKDEEIYNQHTKQMEIARVPDKELIRKLSEENYFEFLEKKLDQHEKVLEKYYNNNKLHYNQSKAADYYRQLEVINAKEIL
jgi:hypothetical protein